MALAIRISLPKETVATILRAWLPHCDQIIAYEHNEANRVHCHILMIRSAVTTQRLKQLALREERGNTFWSFKQGTGDVSRYITYMSKGKINPFFHECNIGCYDPESCFTEEEVEQYKQQWTEPLPKIPKQYAEYMDFEKWMKQFVPLEERLTKESIKFYARDFCFRKHMMFHQQCNNQIVNYATTYCYKNHIHA